MLGNRCGRFMIEVFVREIGLMWRRYMDKYLPRQRRNARPTPMTSKHGIRLKLASPTTRAVPRSLRVVKRSREIVMLCCVSPRLSGGEILWNVSLVLRNNGLLRLHEKNIFIKIYLIGIMWINLLNEVCNVLSKYITTRIFCLSFDL